MAENTMSMYPSKDAMIEAMQANIYALEAQLADARKDSDRLDWIIKQSEVIVLGANTSEIIHEMQSTTP